MPACAGIVVPPQDRIVVVPCRMHNRTRSSARRGRPRQLHGRCQPAAPQQQSTAPSAASTHPPQPRRARPPATAFHSQLPSVALRCSSAAFLSASNFLRACGGRQAHGRGVRAKRSRLQRRGQATCSAAGAPATSQASLCATAHATSRTALPAKAPCSATRLSFHFVHAGRQLLLLFLVPVRLLPHLPQLCSQAAAHTTGPAFSWGRGAAGHDAWRGRAAALRSGGGLAAQGTRRQRGHAGCTAQARLRPSNMAKK